MEAGDVAWMLISTALVVFMVPGLALFYGGIIGGLLLGLFADNSAINNEIAEFQDGLFFGGGELLIDQIVAMASVVAFSFALTWVIAKGIDATIGLRVSPEAEDVGLDQSEHAETAYNYADSSIGRI